MDRKRFREVIFRSWVYFRRGHGVYFAFIISFLNFIVIQYRLLIERIPFLNTIFPRLWIFVISFLVCYIPIVVLLGWWDTRRGVYREESRILWERNPVAKEMYDRIKEIERKIDEIMKKLEGRS